MYLNHIHALVSGTSLDVMNAHDQSMLHVVYSDKTRQCKYLVKLHLMLLPILSAVTSTSCIGEPRHVGVCTAGSLHTITLLPIPQAIDRVV